MRIRGVTRLGWVARLLLGSAILAAPAGHARQLEAHTHGKATLLVALEDTTLEIAFSSPAVNLVGFEHAPRDAEQKRSVDDALRTLEDPVALFEIDPSARCSVVEVEVETGLAHTEEHHDDEHQEEGKHADEHPHHERDENAGEHADFDARYRFSCSQPERLESLVIQLFRHFPLIEQIEVQSVSPRGQRVQELSARAPRLRL